MKVISSDRISANAGPESLAIRAGGMIFTSALRLGQGSDGPDALAEDVQHVLGAMGGSPDKVAKCKITVDDWSAFESWKPVHARLFEAGLPALSAVGGQLRGRSRLGIELISGSDARPQVLGSVVDSIRPEFGARLGDLVFTNGFSCQGKECVPDLAAQSRIVLAKVDVALGAGGSACREALKINGTPATWHSFGEYNAAYSEFFHEPYAGRASIQGDLPDAAALIGIEVVASSHSDRITVESTVPGVWHNRKTLRDDTIYLDDLHPLKGPHSHGVRAGGVIFAAGACPYDAQDALDAPGSIVRQTARTMDNLAKILTAMGSGLSDIVKTNVTLSDLRLLDSFDAAYAGYFPTPYPARQVVATGLAQPGMLVEIEAIAVVGARKDGLALVGKDC